MPIWMEMEDLLLTNWKKREPKWKSTGYRAIVQACFRYVQLIRKKALSVQLNSNYRGSKAVDFLSEYWPALLYHTVSAIGYPALSPFKRLLAVYNASSIINMMTSKSRKKIKRSKQVMDNGERASFFILRCASRTIHYSLHVY
jgi:hypothetical protein